MPELPEVEVTRRSFAEAIAGARILAVRLGKPLRWPLGCPVESLVGLNVVGVRRRGKYLLIDLDRGLLLVHLGMSGSLRFSGSQPEPGKHDHWDLQTSAGTLRLHDPRRFGAVVYAQEEEAPVAKKLLGGLGMEPLGPSFFPAGFSSGRQSQSATRQAIIVGGEVGGGCWQYLCIRGALSCGNPSHGSGILSGASAYPAAVSSHRAGFGQGDRAGRKQSERFFKCRRIFRAFPERCSGVRTGGIAVLRLQHPRENDQTRAAQQFLLPELPTLVAPLS